MRRIRCRLYALKEKGRARARVHLLVITQGWGCMAPIYRPSCWHACMYKIIIIPLTSLGEIVLGISKSIIHSDASRTLPATWVEWNGNHIRLLHGTSILESIELCFFPTLITCLNIMGPIHSTCFWRLSKLVLTLVWLNKKRDGA